MQVLASTPHITAVLHCPVGALCVLVLSSLLNSTMLCWATALPPASLQAQHATSTQLHLLPVSLLLSATCAQQPVLPSWTFQPSALQELWGCGPDEEADLDWSARAPQLSPSLVPLVDGEAHAANTPGVGHQQQQQGLAGFGLGLGFRVLAVDLVVLVRVEVS